MSSISTAPDVDVVQPRDEVGGRGLARPGRPDQRDELAGLGVEVDVLEAERDRGEHGRGGHGVGVGRLDGSGLDRLGVGLACLDRQLDLRRPLGLGEAFLVEDRVVGPLRGHGRGRVLERDVAEADLAARSWRGRAATASGASTISGSISRYSKIRSNRASEPWISTWTLSSWPSGKNSRLWSVVKATIVAGRRGVRAAVGGQRAGQPVHERRHDREDRADDHEEPATDHRLADLERGQAPVEAAELARSTLACWPNVFDSRMPETLRVSSVVAVISASDFWVSVETSRRTLPTR